jgi:hypothetical protein
MPELSDLELLVRSQLPVLVVETHEEPRAVELLKRLALKLIKPLFAWSVTEGLRRVDVDLPAQRFNTQPEEVLKHIRANPKPGIYVLLDFHPYLDDPMHVRLIKEIAQANAKSGDTLVLLSHAVKLPAELERLSARFALRMPDIDALRALVHEEAAAWQARHPELSVRTDDEATEALVRNLGGLSLQDARRLARQAIADDGALTASDLPEVMAAKHRLLDQGGILAFEYETARFAEIAGMSQLKRWLEQRRSAFLAPTPPPGLDTPKGLLLLGVQGGGKSLAAKGIAGMWGVPLLRLDFGVLYNKYYGETERNLRESLATAEVMAPCVLWIDEVEKGLAGDSGEGGPSRRVLGSLLTWMAERDARVFLALTANSIEELPPEFVRKGRLDEIFFVDLPDAETRAAIFAIHLAKREIKTGDFELGRLAELSEGFSGAEIEQAVVAALYAAHARGGAPRQADLAAELLRTRPLSVVMAERIERLRAWARERTVPAD